MTTGVAFPFFVGCERSGTTLTRAMFDSHPGLAVAEEFNFAMTLSRDAGRYAGPPLDAAAVVETVTTHPFFFRWNLAPEAVSKSVDEAAPQTLADVIRAVYAAYAEAQGKPRYADKNPRYVLHMPRLAALLPEARFVHIIRDGRDVALSLLDVRWGADSVEEAAMTWRKRAGTGVREGRALGSSRYREVRYEELVGDPERIVRDLCVFLELSYDAGMLRYFERADKVLTTKRYPDEHPHLFQPPTSGLRDWRREMSPSDRALFESIAGDLLGQLGYEVEGITVPARMRVRSRAKQARIGAVSAARRLRRASRKMIGSRKA